LVGDHPGAVATVADALLSSVLPGGEVSAILFLGIGLTFLVLYFLPADRGHQPWAIIPGGILIIMAALAGLAFGTAGRFVWPILLMAGGAFLVFRALGRRRGRSIAAIDNRSITTALQRERRTR
jgi:hypothetical protein